MKNLFSNPRFLHIFYGSVVAMVCSYFLFFAQKNENQFEKVVLKEMILNLESAIGNLHHEIKKTTRAYRNSANLKYENRCEIIDERTNELIKHLTNLQVESNTDAKEIDVVHQKITILDDSIRLYVGDRDKNYFEKNNFWKILVSEPDFWNNLKKANLKEKNLIFDQIKIGLLNEKYHYFIFVAQYIGGSTTNCDTYLLAINPYQNSVRVGEKFEADLCLAAYSTSVGNIDFILDNDTLLRRDGIAHIQKVFSKPGKYIIHPKASFKNPFSNEVNSISRDYVINVIPK
jgi:hypothetical protein